MKPLDEKVAAYERDLPGLLEELRREEEVERSPSHEALREARFLRSIDAALQAPARSAVSRIARAAGALSLAAAAVLGVLALESLRGNDALPPISGESVRAAKTAAAKRPTPGEQVVPPAADTKPIEAPRAPPARVQRSRSDGTAPGLERADKPTLQETVPAPTAEPPASTLAEENRLFEQAAAAERRGDLNASLATLDRLVAAYPASPLAQQALVRKFRALQRANRRVEAARAAREYLATYPNGFAQHEAAQVASSDASGARP